MKQQEPGRERRDEVREALGRVIEKTLPRQGPLQLRHREWMLGRFDHGAWLFKALEEFGVSLHSGQRFLDVGSGFGGEALAFACDAVETISVEAFRNGNLQAIASSFQLPLRVVQADGHRLPFPDESFDVSGAFEVIEHVAGPQVFTAEMARVTRKGGLVLMTTPIRPWVTRFLPDPHYKLWGLALCSVERQEQIVNSKGLGPYERADLFASAGEVRRMFEKAGLQFGVYADQTRRGWLAPLIRLFFGRETGAYLVPGRRAFFWGRKK